MESLAWPRPWLRGAPYRTTVDLEQDAPWRDRGDTKNSGAPCPNPADFAPALGHRHIVKMRIHTRPRASLTGDVAARRLDLCARQSFGSSGLEGRSAEIQGSCGLCRSREYDP